VEHRVPIDLAAVAETALAGASAAAQKLKITTHLEPVLVHGDHALIERLVRNLIDNAITHNRPAGWIEVRTQAATRGAVLSVSNTGPTIPPEQMDDLFEPFRRLGGDRTGSEGHHGLGLSIVRSVAQAHQADLDTTPLPGGGLSLTVSFPA
jgi:signal transduction histidine kinase